MIHDVVLHDHIVGASTVIILCVAVTSANLLWIVVVGCSNFLATVSVVIHHDEFGTAVVLISGVQIYLL